MSIASVVLSVGSSIVRGTMSVLKGTVALASKSLVAKFIFGGAMIAAASLTSKSSAGKESSPTYQPIKYTQTNPDLPLPIIYGTVKTAGNLIWQNAQEKFSQKIIAFSEGEITDITDIRINDMPVSSVYGTQIEKYLGTDSQLIASVAPGASQLDKTANVGSLKNVAYLGLTVFNGEKVSSSYNLTAVVVGKKIRVYSSPTQYTVQYSENPAWVLFDFLTSYNGLGIALNDNSEVDDTLVSEIFDLNSFIESAAYCDTLVNGKPRFSFNMIFDAQGTSARSLLDEIYRSCRGGLFFKNGLLQFKIDKAEPVSRVFSEEDIANETFKAVPSEEYYDIVKCVYISPEHEWQKVEAFAEIPEYREGAPIENTVDVYSCTNFEQASRLAWYYSNAKVLQPYYGSFETDFRAYDIEVGDVIKFDSILMGVKGYKVKVTSVTDDGAGTYTVYWQTYDERLYNDSLGGLKPRVLISKLNDLFACPPDVTGFNVIQSGNLFNFVWNKIENVTYEIRKGMVWESADIVASSLTENCFSCDIPSVGTYTFLIKAFNKYNYSETPALDVISVDYVPEQNIVLSQNILSEDGYFSDTYLYQGILKLSPSDKTWRILDGFWNEVELEDYSINSLWGAKTVEYGYFVSKVFDLGKSFNNISSVDFVASGCYEILFRYADDEETLTTRDFTPFVKGQYSYRYFQLKIVLKIKLNEISNIKDVVFYVDVPDKTASFTIEITDSQNGYVLDFSEAGFYSVPGIVATVTDNVFAYAVTAEKTSSSARIFAITNDGQKTTAKTDVQLFGY